MEDMTQLKANILGGMNAYVLENFNDEFSLDWWSFYVPKDITEEELIAIAKDERKFKTICFTFGKLVKGVEGYIG